MSVKRWLLFLRGAVLLGVIGCASYKHGSVEIRRINEYTAHIAAGGIEFAADPYDTPEKAKNGFYEDVTEKNFYPVNLIFNNTTAADRFLVMRETAEVIDVNGNNYKPVRCTIMSDECEHNKMAYALFGFGIFSYMSAEEANQKMATDWREKEIPDSLIIQSGKKANGFLYFRLPEGNKIKGCKLKIEAEKIESKEKIPLEVVL